MAHSIRCLLVVMSLAFAAPASLIFTATSAQAQSPHSLRRASDEYRDAALAFERHVHRAGYFDHYDKRLADRLENVSSDFRGAARNPGDLSRLLYHWNDLTTTHARVAQSLVVGCGRPDPELIRCWQRVDDTLGCLAIEMQCFTHDHHLPHVSNRPSHDGTFPANSPEYESLFDGRSESLRGQNRRVYAPQLADPRFQNDPRFAAPGFQEDRFLGARPLVPSQPSVQIRPNFPPFDGSRFSGSQGSQVDSRREVGAVIAASILNRLLN